MSAAMTTEQTPSRFELLNPKDHGKLRLSSRVSNRPHFVQIVASEFSAAAVCSPILITKEASTGNFYVGAMLGFKAGECLLPTPADRGGFQPLNFQRDGFFISGEQIAIDVSNARFSETEGEPLFDEGEQPSAQMRQIQRVLGQLQEALSKTDAFIATLARLKLIEPIEVSLSFDDGERLNLQGLYTVSMDSLQSLADADVVQLFRSGDLQRIYVMNASLSQLGTLADKRNRQSLAST